MCDSFDSVASGIGEWLHDGRGHSYPAGHRHRRGTGPSHSGTKNIVASRYSGQARGTFQNASFA